MTSFSYIIPTMGRTTLALPLVHLTLKAQPGDEVLVGVDPNGDRALAYQIATELCPRLPCIWHLFEGQPGCYGNHTRDMAIQQAHGDRLVFMDDDDTFLPDGIATMRSVADEHPDRPLMFRMLFGDGKHLWSEPILREANVGTPMFVPLNRPGLPRWDEHCDYLSDFKWISRVISLQGPPVWREEKTVLVDSTHLQIKG